MSEEEIEVRLEFYLDSLDVDHVDYQHVFTGILEREDKKIIREARYDTREQTIEFRSLFCLEGETIEEDEWAAFANVMENGNISDPDVIEKGEDLREVMREYLKRRAFAFPENELGEMFYDATGVK